MDYANDTAMTLLKGNTGFNAPSTGNGGLSAMGNELWMVWWCYGFGIQQQVNFICK